MLTLAEIDARLDELPREPGVYIFRGTPRASTPRASTSRSKSASPSPSSSSPSSSSPSSSTTTTSSTSSSSTTSSSTTSTGTSNESDDEILYIGKAASLRTRVRQYFRASNDGRAFIPTLRRLLTRIDTIITRTEKEALLLENELVKKHQPRFNVELRDDKRFLCLRVASDHPWPRIHFVRKKRPNDKARYFGPYASAASVRRTLNLLNKFFGLRSCRDGEFARRTRPCLQHQIGRCPAPCVLNVDRDAYQRSLADAMLFLEGRTDELATQLTERMWHAAENGHYERAAKLRDQIAAVERSVERQSAVSMIENDRDLFGFARRADRVEIAHLAIRAGRLLDSQTYSLKRQEFPDDEILGSFLIRFYEMSETLPDEVLLPFEVENMTVLAEWLTDRRGKRVAVLAPQRGDRTQMLDIAQKNAQQNIDALEKRGEDVTAMLDRLKSRLKLRRTPSWIECFDISHFQGLMTVASQTVFIDGKPDKTRYRRYRLREQDTPDDFASMEQVIRRRLTRAKREGIYPDLIVIDGGKGQLSVAKAVADELGLADLDIVGLAKSRTVKAETAAAFREKTREKLRAKKSRDTPAPDDNTTHNPDDTPDYIAKLAGLETPAPDDNRNDNSDDNGDDDLDPNDGLTSLENRSPERVFLPARKDPIILRQNSPELFVLTRIRDEAHRFAITYHRKLSRGRMTRSLLHELPGVGPKRARILLREFGSLKRIAEADANDLVSRAGITPALAEAVLTALRTRT